MIVLSTGLVGATELTVLTSMGVVSGVRDVASAFERATGHKVIVSFEAGPSLMQKVTSTLAALTAPDTLADRLIETVEAQANKVLAPELRPKRIAELTAEITRLEYVEEQLVLKED